MKFSFNNLIAIASLLVWAGAWVATETQASAEVPSSATVAQSTR